MPFQKVPNSEIELLNNRIAALQQRVNKLRQGHRLIVPVYDYNTPPADSIIGQVALLRNGGGTGITALGYFDAGLWHPISVSGTGIQFDVNNQGNWLHVETIGPASAAGGSPSGRGAVFWDTSNAGIELKSGWVDVLIPELGQFPPPSGAARAGIREIINSAAFAVGDTVAGIWVDFTNTYAGSDSATSWGIRISMTATHGPVDGVNSQAVGNSTFASGREVRGVFAQGKATGTGATGPAIGIQAEAFVNATTVSFGVGGRIRGFLTSTNTTTQIGGVVAEAYGNAANTLGLATTMLRAKKIQAITGFTSAAATDEVGGLLLDVQGGGSAATSKAAQIYVQGVLMFQIDMDGTVHNKTGKAYLSDL
jgi:hypothetical protein